MSTIAVPAPNRRRPAWSWPPSLRPSAVILRQVTESWLRTLRRGIPLDAAPSALVWGVVTRGRRICQEIHLVAVVFPRLWSNEEGDDEDTRVDAA